MEDTISSVSEVKRSVRFLFLARKVPKTKAISKMAMEWRRFVS